MFCSSNPNIHNAPSHISVLQLRAERLPTAVLCCLCSGATVGTQKTRRAHWEVVFHPICSYLPCFVHEHWSFDVLDVLVVLVAFSGMSSTRHDVSPAPVGFNTEVGEVRATMTSWFECQ